uniref:hypothetical protein n=1 Tax=Roseovarius indicus TaxID=540747 RepID=UPI003B52A48A
MKAKMIAALTGVLIAATARAAPLEEDAVYSNDWSPSYAQTLADEATAVIRSSGYRCDSVSSIRAWVFSPGFDVYCNGYRYGYELKDRGGRWTATLK